MTYPTLTLYIGSSCRFCARVLDYLKENPLPITIKDVWSDEAALEELNALAGKTQVPCLKINDAYMHESLDIIEKLKEIKALA